MVGWRKIIAGVIAGLLISAAAYADMVPASAPDAGRGPSPRVCSHTCTNCADCPWACNCPNIAVLDLPSVGFLPRVNADAGQTSAIQYPPSLTDGASSFSLCLYALMGLGLVRSAPWVKKLSFGFLPEWYHDGGPFQIGHSHAVTPNNLSLTPACCFIQPDCMPQDISPQYYKGIIASLLRTSLFTPNVLAPRGPPLLS
jgi:hypothetical protein